ncbi:MAG: SAM-dependent methyltransferase [Bacteroidetes bacterium]|nr:SAM-dependent methyltransferase [Bacteroidota bacterium]
MKPGVLYLIPSVLSDRPVEEVLPEGTLTVIRSLNCFIVEELKTARRFLRKAGYTRNFDEVTFCVYNEHSPLPSFEEYLKVTDEGTDIGLLSEAGSPCIADPGSEIVRIAHENAITVKPLTGPSSILLSLMASGFSGQNFAFLGYLPVDKQMRVRRLKEIEKAAGDKKQTQIFIETPYRNEQVFQAILQSCKDNTMLGLGIGLTGASEKISVYSVRDWRQMKFAPDKSPTVFMLYRY